MCYFCEFLASCLLGVGVERMVIAEGGGDDPSVHVDLTAALAEK